MNARSFTDALAADPLDLAVIGRLWSRDGGMGNERSEEDYSDEGCRVLARHAFRDVNDLLAEVRELRESRERAIRWAVHLEGQDAAALALHSPEKRYHPRGNPEWSADSAEEAAQTGDCGIDDIDHFLVCSHCGEIEGRQAGYEWDYLAALWPCATAKALGAALAGGEQE